MLFSGTILLVGAREQGLEAVLFAFLGKFGGGSLFVLFLIYTYIEDRHNTSK